MRDITTQAIADLDAGRTPTWSAYISRPDDPAPTYAETIRALGYGPDVLGPDWREAVGRSSLRREGVIPFRPRSYRVHVPAARATDPQTSHEAARSVRNQTETHRRILSLFKLNALDGLTDEELAGQWQGWVDSRGWPPVSESGLRTRRHELVILGLLQDSGDKRLTRGGRRTTVWRLA